MDDGNEIRGKFFLRASVVVVENHDFCTMFLDNPFNEIKPESAETVSMRDHNFSETILECEFQNGFKTFAFEVDSGSDVGDNVMFWEFRFEEVNLSLEIIFLPVRRDSAVTDFSFFWYFFLGFFSGYSVIGDELFDIVHSLTWSSNGVDETFVCPDSQGLAIDSKSGDCFGIVDILWGLHSIQVFKVQDSMFIEL